MTRLNRVGSRRQELTQLQLELPKVSQRLDEIQRQSFCGGAAAKPEAVAVEGVPLYENPEIRPSWHPECQKFTTGESINGPSPRATIWIGIQVK
jgi:hypothetical protein